MDPIDDRIMQKMQQEHGDKSCLLGYNTNRGLRIDVKLRTDDLRRFRPYSELVSTLIHELSHNWVGDHNLLFWTNYAQMRAEYLYTHARLRGSSRIVRGKTTAELAGLDKSRLENVFEFIMFELVRDMAQHGLHPRMIESPIRQRIRELQEEDERNRESQGYRLGGGRGGEDAATAAAANGIGGAGAGRELARLAAERRAREQERKKTDGER